MVTYDNVAFGFGPDLPEALEPAYDEDYAPYVAEEDKAAYKSLCDVVGRDVLGRRITHSLWVGGVRSVQGLAHLPDKDLLQVRGLGGCSLLRLGGIRIWLMMGQMVRSSNPAVDRTHR